MKKALIFLTAMVVCVAFSRVGWAADASITGIWSMPILTGKDKGKERQVEIFEKNGTYYGKIVKLQEGAPANQICTICKKDRKDQPLIGMLVLWDLKKEAGRYVEGGVYDVDQGKDYKCTIALMTQDRLKLTACIFSLVCNSHYWTRVK